MKKVQVFADKTELGEAAAKQSVKILKDAVARNGYAVWVLAGGSTPLPGYQAVVDKYADALDWTKVTLVMGDERIGPNDGPDNNWHAIDKIIGKIHATKVFPNADQSAEDAAEEYEVQLSVLPKGDAGVPRLDLVWLGIGPDGHTLSLFPNHASLLPSGGLVTAVHDSPKPPADRITLNLRAMQGAEHVMVLATGKDKQKIIAQAVKGNNLPIALVARIVETHEGSVTWLVDKSAAPAD